MGRVTLMFIAPINSICIEIIKFSIILFKSKIKKMNKDLVLIMHIIRTIIIMSCG